MTEPTIHWPQFMAEMLARGFDAQRMSAETLLPLRTIIDLRDKANSTPRQRDRAALLALRARVTASAAVAHG